MKVRFGEITVKDLSTSYAMKRAHSSQQRLALKTPAPLHQRAAILGCFVLWFSQPRNPTLAMDSVSRGKGSALVIPLTVLSFQDFD